MKGGRGEERRKRCDCSRRAGITSLYWVAHEIIPMMENQEEEDLKMAQRRENHRKPRCGGVLQVEESSSCLPHLWQVFILPEQSKVLIWEQGWHKSIYWGWRKCGLTCWETAKGVMRPWPAKTSFSQIGLQQTESMNTFLFRWFHQMVLLCERKSVLCLACPDFAFFFFQF